MDKKEIASREDIYLLVLTFYERIKKDDLIGPIFIKMIPQKEWEDHLIKLTD